MALATPTTQELAAMRNGLFFGASTTPTLDEAQTILDESVLEVLRIFNQYGIPQETIDAWDGTELVELQNWFSRIILYRAMAEVMDRQRGASTDNTYRKNYVRERQLALTSPAAIGLPFDPEEDEWAQKPTNSVSEVGLEDQVLEGVYDAYFRRPGGF